MPCSGARERSSHAFSTVYAAGLGSSTSFLPLQRVLSSKSGAGVFPSTFVIRILEISLEKFMETEDI